MNIDKWGPNINNYRGSSRLQIEYSPIKKASAKHCAVKTKFNCATYDNRVLRLTA